MLAPPKVEGPAAALEDEEPVSRADWLVVRAPTASFPAGVEEGAGFPPSRWPLPASIFDKTFPPVLSPPTPVPAADVPTSPEPHRDVICPPAVELAVPALLLLAAVAETGGSLVR